MAIDIQKSLKVAMIPIAILVVIGIVTNVIGHIPFLGLILCAIGPILFLVQLVVLGWAGYKSVKEAQMDIAGGAVTGALTGGISGFINAIVGFVLGLIGLGASVAGGGSMFGAAVGAAVGIVALILGIIFGTIFGAILGAIFGAAGAYYAGMKK